MPQIIVIDDDLGMRVLLEKTLSSAGHDVFTTHEGNVGLAYARVATVDLLITDLIMPGMEGMETIKKFRSEFVGVPIIAISGDHDLLKSTRHLSALNTLPKPFQPSRLLELVKDILEPSPTSQTGEQPTRAGPNSNSHPL